MIEAKLYSRLKTVCPTVYPLAAPLDYALPCLVYNRIATEPTRDITDDDDDTAYVTFQIDAYSTRFMEAQTIARTVRASMKSWQDDDIQSVAYTDKQDMIDNTTEVQLFRVMTMFKLFVRDI